jgi:rsbT co-antagonist protein RsbR
MTTTSSTIPVDRERIEQVLKALAQAALGNYDIRVDVSGVADEFLELEVALNLLIEELGLARRETREQHAEISRQAVQLAAQQAELVRALSTPIIAVWPGVLALPIVGTVDADRATQMSESMLQRVVADRATHVILDLTGAGSIAAETARSLLRMAQAVRMLGSRCLLTGISPEMAQTLIQLDFDATDVQTLPQLSDALVRVLSEKGQRLVKGAPRPGPPEKK